jgi:WhiB family redox-sensing transcriptional regulator
MTRAVAATIPDLSLPGPWIRRAACRDVYAEIFWPTNENDPDPRAIAICDDCPVRKQCLLYAINNGQWVGLWGGYTPRQRAAIADEPDRRRRVDTTPTPLPVRCGWCGSRRCDRASNPQACDHARAKRDADE